MKEYIQPVWKTVLIAIGLGFVFVVLFFVAQIPVIITQVSQVLALIGSAISAIYSMYITFRQTLPFLNSNLDMEIKECPKVLFWIIDGLNVQAFHDVAKENRDLKFLMENGYYTECVTIFPSITPAAHATLITGWYPKKTRIPAFDWVEEKPCFIEEQAERKYWRCMPDFKRYQGNKVDVNISKKFFSELGDAFELNQQLLNPNISTVFETLGEDHFTECIKEWIHRGTDDFIGTTVSQAIREFSSKLERKSSMINVLGALYREGAFRFAGLDWGNRKCLADLIVYWKTGTDTKSHSYGPNHPEVRIETEEAIQKLADTIRFYRSHTNKPLYVVITADHSQSEVHQYSDLVEKLEKFSRTRKLKFASRDNRHHPEKLNNADIIIANNDRAAFIYIFKKDVQDDVIGILEKCDSIDLIIYRDKELKVIQVHEDGASSKPEAVKTFFQSPKRQEKYPNAVERIEGLIEGEKWGDIAVSLKDGYTLDPAARDDLEIGWFLKDKENRRGDHGGLNAEDSIVPLLIWGPDIRKEKIPRPTARTVDIAPTIARMLGKKHECDGDVLDVFVKEKEEPEPSVVDIKLRHLRIRDEPDSKRIHRQMPLY